MSRAALNTGFLYQAAKPTGGRTFGLRSARSERALSESLRKERLTLVRSWRVPSWLVSERDMTTREHAAFNEQLAQLLSRGVPLVEALEVCATVVKDSSKGRVDRLRELVAAGASFADACKKVGSFDNVTIAVYRAAERTGDLAGAALQIARNVRRQIAIADKAATLLLYPVIVSVIGFTVAVAMVVFILPMIGEALTKAGIELPSYTQAIVTVGNTVRTNGLLSLGIFAGIIIAIVLGRASIIRAFTSTMRSLPGVRTVVLKQETARFFSVMAALSRGGIPLADALGVASEVIGHPRLHKQLGKMRQKLIEGGVLRQIIDGVTSLPLATRRLLIAADQAGDLETAFEALAQDMTEEVDKATTRLLAVLEPILILLMFVFIGGLLLSIMIPLMSATNNAF